MKKIISTALSLVILLSALPIVSTSAITSNKNETGAANDTAISALDYEEGTCPSEEMPTMPVMEGEGMCGETVYFNCSFDTYTMKIWGNGDMWNNYSFDYYAFFMESLVISDGVNSIGVNSFTGFKIKTVTISSSLKYIKQGAFKDCNNLTDVYYQGAQSQWNAISIADDNACLMNARIHFTEEPSEPSTEASTEALEPVCELNYNELSDGTLEVCGFNNTGSVDLVIPSEHNGKTVTKIAESVFANNSDIISVTLPETITYIDRTAFGYCSNLETINYNCTNAEYDDWNNYTGNYVFNGCNAVKEINIGNNVESIPDYAFAGIDIDSISNFIIPENVKTIGQKILNNNVTINTLEYNAIECEVGVIEYRELGEYTETHYYKAFPKLNTVIVGKNVKEIPSDTYREPFAETNLSTAIFKDGIKNVSGFRGCDQITEIIIPEGTAEISEEAFLNCSKLETVIIPKSVTKVGKNAFYNTSWLNNQTSDAVYINNTLYQYNNSEETEVIVREGTTTILDFAFGGMDNLLSVTLPDNLTSIGDHAFDGCSAIKAINIPDNVSSIGSYAFSDCTSLLSVHIGNRITIIPERCFNGCTNLEDINIEKNIETIGDGAFAGSGFVRVFVPDNVTYLGSFAFGGCSNLKEVRIGKGIEIINCGTFINCVNLEKVTFSESVKQILGVSTHGSYWDSKDFGAFENCSNLTSIGIPNGVEVIGSYVFRGCSNLINVTLPVTLESIGSETFYNCTNLSSIIIPKSVNTIGKHAFWNCPRLSDIYIFNPVCQIFIDYETLSGSASIHGYDGSTAQLYAGNYNRTFMIIEDEPTVLGDVDGDGVVSIIDATCIQRRLAEIPVYSYNEAAADTDGDGEVTILDATGIQRYLAEFPCFTGIGEPIS